MFNVFYLQLKSHTHWQDFRILKISGALLEVDIVIFWWQFNPLSIFWPTTEYRVRAEKFNLLYQQVDSQSDKLKSRVSVQGLQLFKTKDFNLAKINGADYAKVLFDYTGIWSCVINKHTGLNKFCQTEKLIMRPDIEYVTFFVTE